MVEAAESKHEWMKKDKVRQPKRVKSIVTSPTQSYALSRQSEVNKVVTASRNQAVQPSLVNADGPGRDSSHVLFESGEEKSSNKVNTSY